jgi:predicted alpha/beta hydrolase
MVAILRESATGDLPQRCEPLELEALDGTPLGATHYSPGSKARGAVLIVPAMGVPQTFYAPLCTWLASEGFHALTFDYRGMGSSRRGSLRAVDTDIVGWAELDTAAALRWLEIRSGGLPITWLGHSLGGQIVPFVRDRRSVARIITVAAGSGYWRDNAPALRRKVWLLWFGIGPLATALFGYFPGKRLGMVGDLPRNVMRQWRKWCLDEEYAAGAEGDAVRELFARVEQPILSLSFTDDDMMSEASIRGLHVAYTGAEVELRRLSPGELGLPRVGHFGAFRRDLRAAIWEPHLLPALAT